MIDVVTTGVESFSHLCNLLDYPKASISIEQCKEDGVKFVHHVTFFDDENNKILPYTHINDCRSINVVFTEKYNMTIYDDIFGVNSSTSIPEYVTDLFLVSRLTTDTNVPKIPVNQLKIPKSLESFYIYSAWIDPFTNFLALDYVNTLTLCNYKFNNNIELPQNIKHLVLKKCTGICIKLPSLLESVSFIECHFTESVVKFPDGLDILDISNSEMAIDENFPDSITKCSINSIDRKHISTPTKSINNWPINLKTLYLKNLNLNIPNLFPHRLKTLHMENCQSPNKLFPTEWPDSITSLTLKTQLSSKYTTAPSYWPRNCVTMNIMNWSKFVDTPLPDKLPSSVTMFTSNDPHVIPVKWPDSLKTIKCNTSICEINYPEEWPPNINHIKLHIHEKTHIPSVLPDGLVKFEINSSNCEHIPNYWPASLENIVAKFECGLIPTQIPLFIRKSDVEKYKKLGIDITPQQLFMIMKDITKSVDECYSDDSDDNEFCTWCGRN
jgi:hypothetical protein